MPDDSKKNQHKKGKSDAKEQRKPRQSRHQVAHNSHKIDEKKSVESKVPAPVVNEKPEYVDPGPEFYKNLKRETDDILKITEDENSKYKKKEIQSNWAKYEIPIESYDEIEEQESMGADYEKLIEAPLSIGGHFQFKHEKSWDLNTGPSLYDHFFDINMDNLAIAVQTIPFYERNKIDKTLFSESELISMNNRSIKYKQKYYNDKSFTTPELEAQHRILNSLTSTSKVSDIEKTTDLIIETKINQGDDIVSEIKNTELENKLESSFSKLGNVENKLEDLNVQLNLTDAISKDELNVQLNLTDAISKDELNVQLNLTDAISKDEIVNITKDANEQLETKEIELKTDEINIDDLLNLKLTALEESPVPKNTIQSSKLANSKESTKSPILEAPEDLEKWLDDFLDN